MLTARGEHVVWSCTNENPRKMNGKRPPVEDDSFSEDEESCGEDYDFDDDSFSGDNTDEDDADVTDVKANKKVEVTKKPQISKHLLQLKEKLGLDALKASTSVITSTADKKSSTSTKSGKEPIVVVYNDPRKRKKLKEKKEKPGKVVKNTELSRPEFNINVAKHEVRKLAISSLGKTSKAEARAQLAISLGAIPPKKKSINYKVLKEMKKKEKAYIEEQKQNEKVFVARVSQMAKKLAPKNKNKIANFDAGFGKATKFFKTKGGRK